MRYSLLALLLLGFAFLVLVVTFVWVARLLAMRTGKRQPRAAGDAPVAEAPAEGLEAAPAGAEELAAEGAARVAVSTGANLALVLGLLGLGLFWLSPLLIVVSAAGVYYGCRSLWIGVRRYRTLIYRALVGLFLSLASVGFQYLNLTGRLGQAIPWLGAL